MTATDELRRLLDERGVEYKDRNVFGKHVFHWGKPFHGAMFTDGGEWTELVVENATPEQAVEATLGRGTCHAESDLSEWVCSACQCWIPLGLTSENIQYASEWRYCPHCGAEVKAVSDDER